MKPLLRCKPTLWQLLKLRPSKRLLLSKLRRKPKLKLLQLLNCRRNKRLPLRQRHKPSSMPRFRKRRLKPLNKQPSTRELWISWPRELSKLPLKQSRTNN